MILSLLPQATLAAIRRAPPRLALEPALAGSVQHPQAVLNQSVRHTHCSTGQRSCAPDLDLTVALLLDDTPVDHVLLQDHLEPDLPAAAEPDHLELAPEEEGTDTEVEPKSEENDEPLVTEIINKTATKPRPVVAEINPSET